MSIDEVIEKVKSIRKFNFTYNCSLASDELFVAIIEALEQNKSLKEMAKLGIAKDCESCKAHRMGILNKVESEDN